ncbi:FAD-dependent oxidoreductase [Actinoplanes sp. NPDC051475]|uniref:FAD-dependent oxidoreductase n=1 Tax=Actinoplanes sp. NPDC051475 TaxID=3157225 RepID=UPI00344D74A0
MCSAGPDVVVIGAGVSGLTTGIRLAEHGMRVLIRTAEMPRDTTSAAAGAMWDFAYATHPRVPEWSSHTYDVLVDLAGDEDAGVRLVAGKEASRRVVDVPEWAPRLPGFRVCGPWELPDGFVRGWHCELPVIDMYAYLRYLEKRFFALGGSMELGRLASLDAALALAPTVVNCAGAGARELACDVTVKPIRGQLVAVLNPGVTEFFAEYTDKLVDMTYLLPQGDVLLLGGSAEHDVADPVPDQAVARRIVERCAAIVPAVADAVVLGNRVGIRPERSTVRLEVEARPRGRLVHNYGHGGSGVSLSWGCADSVVQMLAAGAG